MPGLRKRLSVMGAVIFASLLALSTMVFLTPDQDEPDVLAPTMKVSTPQDLAPPLPTMAAIALPPPPPLAQPQPQPLPTVPKPAAKVEARAIMPLKARDQEIASKPVNIKPLEVQHRQPVNKPAPSVVKTEATASPIETAKEGRYLLRLLEHGKGPDIQIDWPKDGADAEQLFNYLRHCEGMVVAVMDGEKFYRPLGPAGRAWVPDMDRTSGFMRDAQRVLARPERAEIREINRYHGLRSGHPVRLFSRRFDAVLLGNLSLAIGSEYADAKSISATYVWQNGRLAVRDIRVNGTAVSGGFTMPRRSRCTA